MEWVFLCRYGIRRVGEPMASRGDRVRLKAPRESEREWSGYRLIHTIKSN